MSAANSSNATIQEISNRPAWSKDSWTKYPIKQQPPYPDSELTKLKTTLDEIRDLPPLVSIGEVETLKSQIAAAGQGKCFIIQGGDCAERFDDCRKDPIENKLRVLLQMSLVLVWKAKIPVCRVWRGAGQFAKPRSSNTEKLPDGRVVPSFRGDNVNGFDVEERQPDPSRLQKAYFHSAATLNYIRALVDGGFASLMYPHRWDLDFVKDEKLREQYNELVQSLQQGIDLIKTIGGSAALESNLDSISLSTAHEGLILAYEQALTESTSIKSASYGFHRSVKFNDQTNDDDDDTELHYNLGSHFLWIGDRTRAVNGAHIEYFRGISNPIGVKCGPTLKPQELQELVRVLNPNKEEGRLSLITRYGAAKIGDLLPAHIKAVQETGIPVTWISDAVHGNTFVTKEGFKSRDIENVWSEIEQAVKIHKQHNSVLGGIHLELTGENVTECVGGSQDLKSSQLSQAYQTYCDPRLNYTQSLDIAFRLASLKEFNETHSKQPLFEKQ